MNIQHQHELFFAIWAKRSPEDSNPAGNSGVFIVNFKHISHLVLVFLLLTLSKWEPAGKRRFLFVEGIYVKLLLSNI